MKNRFCFWLTVIILGHLFQACEMLSFSSWNAMRFMDDREGGSMTQVKAPTPFDFIKAHIRVQVDTKCNRSLTTSCSIIQLEAIRRSAYWLMHYDPDISRIHRHIKQECSSILSVLQKGTTHDRLQLYTQMQKLATVFDAHEHTLQIKVDEFNRGVCAQEMCDVVTFQLQVTRYLKQELHKMVGTVQERLSTSDGTFLGRMQNKFTHFLKSCLGFWTPEGIIRAYLKQYDAGIFTELPMPRAVHLERVANNVFNQAVQKLDLCLKHGDLKGASRIIGQFVSHKEQYQLMQQFQRSSPYITQEGLPICWQANPKWSAYHKMLSRNKHDIKQIEQIKGTLQQEHMQARELCRQSGINEPTHQQLNQVHQLLKYHADPNFLEIACKGLQQSTSTNVVLDTLEQRSNMLHEAKTLLGDQALVPSDTHAYYQSREQALHQMAQGNLLTSHKEYTLSPQATEVLKQAGCNPAQLTSCKGNLVQQDNHAKLIDSLNRLAQKPVRTQAAQQLKDGVLDCAQAGNALNQAGSLKEAMLMSDVCHVAVECVWHFVDSMGPIGMARGLGLEACMRLCCPEEFVQKIDEVCGRIHQFRVGMTFGGAYRLTQVQEVCQDFVDSVVGVAKLTGNVLWLGVEQETLEAAIDNGWTNVINQIRQDQHQRVEQLQALTHDISTRISDFCEHMPHMTPQEWKEAGFATGEIASQQVVQLAAFHYGFKGLGKITGSITTYFQELKTAMDGMSPKELYLGARLLREPQEVSQFTNKVATAQVFTKPHPEAVRFVAKQSEAMSTLTPQTTVQAVTKAVDASKKATKAAGALGLAKQVGKAAPGEQSIERLIEGATALPKKSAFTQQYELKGGFEQAMRDFDSLCLKNVRVVPDPRGKIMVGQLENGNTVVVRDFSSRRSLPTLEVQLLDKRIKFRYT